MEINGKHLCVQCMEPLTEEGICSCCHYDQNSYQPESRFLPAGTVLEDRYVLGKVSGEGNFGITYTGWDTLLESRVAVKEFFPVSRVSRKAENGNTDVFVFQEGNYEEILHKYLEEAKRLSKLNQVQGIVSIRDFFYANNTAYIIMEYIEGISIKEFVEKNGPMSEKVILEMMLPVLNALEQVHDIGLIHRDISPDNIMLTKNNNLVLVDFGSARQVNLSEDKSMTVMIKRGYSSPELYRSRGEQGPWTDVYAICATIYYMLSGKVPDEAIDRILDDETPSLLQMPEVKASVRFRKAIMKGISLKQQERYLNIRELRKDLCQGENSKRKRAKMSGMIVVFAGLILIAGGIAFSYSNSRENKGRPTVTVSQTPVTTAQAPTTPATYRMISCTGMTKDEVLEKIKGLDDQALQIEWKKKYSDTITKGRVIRQSIPEHTEYTAGERKKLILFLSKGKRKVTVPNVVGKSAEEAKRLLVKNKLKYRIQWREEEGRNGIVLTQSRKAGTRCAKNTYIKLIVRKKKSVRQDKNSSSPNHYDGIIY